MDRFRAGKRLWEAEDDALMRARYPHEPTTAIAKALRRTTFAINARADKLGLRKSAEYLASPHACRLRRGDNVGAAFRFKKGQAPANKGLRRPGWSAGRMKSTWFPKGHRGSRTMAIGSTRLCDGYVYRKVSEIPGVWTRNWKLEHYLVWEAAHGPVPPGHAVVFKDRDRMNTALENLELITRRDNMLRNSVHNLPKPLAHAVQLLGALRRQIRKKTEGHEKQDRRSA